jgi:hypothetical protein
MDKNVKTIRPADEELSRVQDNLAATLQQVLDWIAKKDSAASGTGSTGSGNLAVNGTLSVTGASTLKNTNTDGLTANSLAVNGDEHITGQLTVDGATNAKGGLNVTGSSALAGDVTVTGNTIFRNRTDGGVAIVPLANTTAFYTTNAGNSLVKFTIDDAGTVVSRGTITANNFVSLVGGFKTHVNMGTQWRQTTQGGVLRSAAVLSRTDTNGSTSTVCAHVMPFAGSIVGIDFVLDRTIAADITVQVFKNTLGTTGQIIDVMGVKAGNSTPLGPISFAKGTYPFNAGDYLGMGCYVGTGYTFAANFGLVVEYGA